MISKPDILRIHVPSEMKPLIVTKQVSVWNVCPSCFTCWYNFTKFVLLSDLHCRVYYSWLSYMDVNTALLLQSVQGRQTNLFALQIKPTIVMGMSPVYLQFCLHFLSFCLWRVLFVSKIEPVVWNLFTYF